MDEEKHSEKVKKDSKQETLVQVQENLKITKLKRKDFIEKVIGIKLYMIMILDNS